jgi:hypothetical protein
LKKSTQNGLCHGITCLQKLNNNHVHIHTYLSKLVRKDMDVNEHERLSNITLQLTTICKSWWINGKSFHQAENQILHLFSVVITLLPSTLEINENFISR